MTGDQALCSVTAKWVKVGEEMDRNGPVSAILFWRFSFWVYTETVIGRLLRRGKKITCDSQEACSSKSTRLMRCLPPKHSVVAKGCEMWLITALELWLTGAHCQHVRGKRRVWSCCRQALHFQSPILLPYRWFWHYGLLIRATPLLLSMP